MHNDFTLYCIRCRLVLISGRGKLEIPTIGWHQTFHFQTIINLLLLKSYKFHSFRVRNVLVSFLYLIIWYDFAAWLMPFLILLSGDIETNRGPKSSLDKVFQFVTEL